MKLKNIFSETTEPILKIGLKKRNNSKMGNGIYFKIAGYVDLDMPHIFAI
jgi:hypothetical protein